MILPVLTIAVSSCADEIESLLLRMIPLTSRKDIECLVIWQSGYSKEYENCNGVRIIESASIGLSISRNIAIQKSNGSYIWFQDDDFQIFVPEVDKLILNIMNKDCDIYFFKISSDIRPYYKNKSFFSNTRIGRVFKSCSINFVISRSIVKAYCLLFNPKLGLGTNMPCCEENDFLYSALICYSLSYREVDCVPAFHTLRKEKRMKLTYGHLQARSLFLSNFSSLFRFLFSFYWAWKYSRLKEYNNFKFLNIFALLYGIRDEHSNNIPF